MIENQECFSRAMALFDAANSEDPNQDEGQPKELLYARRMSDMSARFAPEASEAAQLAVRAQHIQRWKVPRNTYPMTKEGYHAWRTGSTLQNFVDQLMQNDRRRLHIRVQVSNFESVCRMVEAGVGIGIVPESAALRHRQTMKILIKPVDEDWALRERHVLARDRKS